VRPLVLFSLARYSRSKHHSLSPFLPCQCFPPPFQVLGRLLTLAAAILATGTGVDVRETGVLGEEPGSLNRLLELLIVKRRCVRKEGAQLCGASGILSVKGKVSDDVACDMVTWPSYDTYWQF
jgi:hypothetical protein